MGGVLLNRVRLAPLLFLLVAAAPLGDAHPALPIPAPLASADAPAPAVQAPGVALRAGEAPHVVRPRAAGLAAGPATASGYDLEYACPRGALGLFGEPSECPVRIVDHDDVLGNPALAVDPLPTGRMAFASLHGDPAGNGPSRLSRGNQTHTTFTTDAFGSYWEDQPYYPPSGVSGESSGGLSVGAGPVGLSLFGSSPSAAVFGEDVHALMDSEGTLHVASLYAIAPADANATWSYAVAQWKFDPELNVLDYAVPSRVFLNRTAGSAIEAVWLVEVPELSSVALLWRERAPENAVVAIGGRNLTRWISAAITPADPFSPWKPLGDGVVLGSCERTTNPVARGPAILLGCMAGATGSPPDEAQAGETLLYAIDLEARGVELAGRLPMRGGDPRIAVDDRGRLAAVTVEAIPDASPPRVRAEISTSPDGIEWTRPRPFGDALHNASLGVADARIQAILHRSSSNTVHLVYLEEASVKDRAAGRPQWRKALVVVDPLGAVLLHRDLGLTDSGELFAYLSRSNFLDGTDYYGDARDSLIEVGGREFLAYADYGVVVFTELIERDTRQHAIAAQEPPPAPEPVANTVVAGVGVGVVAASVAAEAIRRALAARRAAALGHGRGRP